MDYKNLGKSGLKVSRICLGSNNFGGQVSEEASIAIINKALDCGINVVDTADVYTGGKSEEIIGKAVKGRRDEVVIATKVGFGIGQAPNQGGLSRKYILRQVRQSLKSLDTDFIDIYFLHRFDPETPLEETLLTLNDLVREGKVRYIACSNFTAWQIAKAHEVCETHDLEKFIATEPPYNLLQRDIEKDLLPYCEEKRIAVLAYRPIAHGGLVNPRGKLKAAMDEINVRGGKKTPAQIALNWLMNKSSFVFPIPRASTPQRVTEDEASVGWRLDAEEMKRLDEASS